MYSNIIAQKLSIKPSQVETVLQLLSEGSTIPFIARYRKFLCDDIVEHGKYNYELQIKNYG